ILEDWGTSTNVTEDFRLAATSPGIDAGTNPTDPLASTLDLSGQPRIADGNGDGIAIVDMGAYELVPPDSDGDCVGNALDCAPLVSSVSTAPGPVGATLR